MIRHLKPISDSAKTAWDECQKRQESLLTHVAIAPPVRHRRTIVVELQPDDEKEEPTVSHAGEQPLSRLVLQDDC